uniref:Bifunctional inhibitor/plant lipid transfer protein/seed storage helical domain-containing protein n=1 Tax=Kalanchoe fedtschenkoi TaxID=63787 RepID=A0A7N0TBZ6_KALFE
MRKISGTSVAVVGLLLLLSDFMTAAEAVTCKVEELSPCLDSFLSSSPPTPQCCSKVKEQEPCLCGYAKNPAYAPYINNPNIKMILDDCQVPYPKC